MTILKSTQESSNFVAILTVALIGATMWIFSPFLHYILVAAVLALATSHGFNALDDKIQSLSLPEWLRRNSRILTSILLTLFFLMMIFLPLLYFIATSYDQMSSIDIEHIKQTIMAMVDKAVQLTDRIPVLHDMMERLKTEGASFLTGPAVETLMTGVQKTVSGVGALIVQITWILTFYFLLNLYGDKILHFLATLMPTSLEHEKYLYRECTGTVGVVFYGTLFNMAAQGLSFGILMAFIGDYDAMYLGVLAGFCSVIPIVGAAMVYVPVVALELFAGHYITAIVVLVFTWVVMGFFIDNILRLIFINYLKKLFGFEYSMNEILILLSILAGISTFGFWGLVIGPSVTALTLAASNLYRDHLNEDEHTLLTGCVPEGKIENGGLSSCNGVERIIEREGEESSQSEGNVNSLGQTGTEKNGRKNLDEG